MSFILHPWQRFFLILSGWVNRQQQEVIEFHNVQIQDLMDKFRRKRILLTDTQRRVLAVRGRDIGRYPDWCRGCAQRKVCGSMEHYESFTPISCL